VATDGIAREAQARGVHGPAIGALVHAARVAAVQALIQED